MNAKEFFDKSVDQATAIIMQVKEADFDKPTPCTEWDVKKLANHILYELLWTADIFEGKTIAEVGTKYDGDLMGEDWQDRWKVAVVAAREAAEKVDLTALAHLSFGDIPMEEYLKQISCDMFMHAWDLGEGIGQKVSFDDETAERLYDFMKANEKGFVGSGMFGTPQKVADDADPQTKLLAAFGRRPDWRAL